MFSRENGDWKHFRARFSLAPSDEIDLHFGRRDPRITRYVNIMAEVRELVEQSLKIAQQNGRLYVMFVHGGSTSRPGKTTARSVVRGFMRSTDATPLVDPLCGAIAMRSRRLPLSASTMFRPSACR